MYPWQFALFFMAHPRPISNRILSKLVKKGHEIFGKSKFSLKSTKEFQERNMSLINSLNVYFIKYIRSKRTADRKAVRNFLIFYASQSKRCFFKSWRIHLLRTITMVWCEKAMLQKITHICGLKNYLDSKKTKKKIPAAENFMTCFGFYCQKSCPPL